MAFSTIQGSGSAPDSFVGTSGVDTISLVNSLGDFVLTALADDDDVQFFGSGGAPAIVDATLKGGDGDDFFTGDGLLFSNVFINGNEDDDELDFETSTFASSTLKGGKGDDEFEVAILNQSLINGNMDDDSIALGFVTSSSVFGGQGVDVIEIEQDLVDSIVNGDDGNDDIQLDTEAFIASTVYGGDGQDTIDADGSASGVVISGDAGDDTLIGSDDEDTILGGDDNDTITGGLEADTMTGGAGDNVFQFALGTTGEFGDLATGDVDVITDFMKASATADGDLIRLSVNPSNTFTFNNAGVVAEDWDELFIAAAQPTVAGGLYVCAVGENTSWTSYLVSVVQGDGINGAIQLGATGQFGTSALATSTIISDQITPLST